MDTSGIAFGLPCLTRLVIRLGQFPFPPPPGAFLVSIFYSFRRSCYLSRNVGFEGQGRKVFVLRKWKTETVFGSRK
jgi:hypothetical protein